jgi:hypothetical protein
VTTCTSSRRALELANRVEEIGYFAADAILPEDF